MYVPKLAFNFYEVRQAGGGGAEILKETASHLYGKMCLSL